MHIKNIFVVMWLVSILMISTSVFGSTIYYCYANDLGTDYLETLKTFQGVVNRGAPRLFVVHDDWDDAILDNLMDYYTNYTWTELTGATQAQARAAVFNNTTLNAICDEMIVYDEDDANLAILCAITEASRYGCCIVEDAEYSEMLNTLGFSVKYDRRGYASWNSNTNCQSWARTQAQSYKTYYCSDIYGMSDDSMKTTPRVRGADYMVKKKMITFLLDRDNKHGTGTWSIQEDIIQTYPNQSISFGWWSSEGDDVTAVTEERQTTMGHGPNVSLLSELSAPGALDQQLPTTVGIYNSNKTYIFVSFSQGDALGFCQWHNLYHWDEDSYLVSGKKIRELYEFGMMHTPLQTDHQPFIPYYYYDTQDDLGKNVLFTGKGYGFNKPSTLYSNNALGGWCDEAADYMEACDLHDMMVADSGIQDNTVVLKNIIKNMDAHDGWVLRSILTKNNLDTTDDEDDDPVIYYNTPIFGDPVASVLDASNDMHAAFTANAIEDSMAERQFFWVFLNHSVTARKMEVLMDKLATESRFDNLEVFHPDKFIKLYRKHSGCGVFPTKLTDDAFCKQDSPTTNYGSNDAVRVRGGATNKKIIGFLKFVVDNSGGTTSIGSATLKLKVEDKNINGVTVRQVSDNSWTEGSITYNNMPSRGTALDQVSNLTSGNWYEFDVSSFVTTAPGTYTLALTTAQDSAGLDFYSKEGNFSNQAQLICDD